MPSTPTSSYHVPFWDEDRLVGKMLNGGKSALKFGGKTMQAAMLLAGLAGVGAYLAITPRGREFREEDTPVAELPPLLTPQDLMMQPLPQEMSGPAEGRAPGEWQARVRGNDQQRAATQPSLDSALASTATQIS